MSTPFEIQTLEESVSNKALTFYHFSVNCLKRRYHCVLESSTIDGAALRENVFAGSIMHWVSKFKFRCYLINQVVHHHGSHSRHRFII